MSSAPKLPQCKIGGKSKITHINGGKHLIEPTFFQTLRRGFSLKALLMRNQSGSNYRDEEFGRSYGDFLSRCLVQRTDERSSREDDI